MAVCLTVLVAFGLTGSPYYLVEPGPVIRVGGSGGGSWSVTTARVRTSTWFQWAAAELRGQRTLRGEGGTGAAADAMRASQANAALVAAHLAAGRNVRAAPDMSAQVRALGAVRGPSAGLLLALARLDALTPGDLTGGRRVAGTGAIAPDGTVTTVGDVPEKVRAAVAARTDVFLVPALQQGTAARAARGTRTRVIGVRSVSEAVTRLCADGVPRPRPVTSPTPPVCPRPS